MIILRTTIFLLLFLLVELGAEFESSFEDMLPFKAELSHDFFPEDQSVKLEKGARFVILRPLDNDLLLVEFPRKGIYQISPSITNVSDYIKEAKEKEETSGRVPRMSYFLANKIISGESGWQYPLRSDTVNCFSRWILFYGDSTEESTIKAIRYADSYYRKLNDADRTNTALVYIDTTGSKTGIQSIADTLKPSIQSMPGYLSRGYSTSLFHIDDEDELPVLVETKSSGRVITKCEGLEQIKHFFDRQD